MARKSLHPFILALAAMLYAPAAGASPVERPLLGKSVCFPTNETREAIKGHHLVEPFVALKNAAASVKAEALSAKLCRLGEEFVYEIALLHRDGRLVHVVMSAASGKVVNARILREAPPRN
jgi:hypothetical protein